jgi:small conductance mechanosensitive channel
MEEILLKLQDWLTLYGVRIVGAILIFVVGRWVAKALARLFRTLMTRRNVEPTLVSFVYDLSYLALLVFVVIAALSNLGIQTTTLVAVVGAAGLAVGLALQGSLANFAAGFLLIFFRPLKVGDYVEAGGTAGTVEEVQMLFTRLTTPDNRSITVPNAKIMGDTIVNYSAKETRRNDLVIGVGYGANIDHVRRVLEEICAADPRILKDPAPMIAVKEMADSSVNFLLRMWARKDDFWNVHFATIEAVKKRFDAEGIEIPFPQRDVHLFQTDEKEAA